MPDLDAILSSISIPLDFLSLVIIYLTYFVTHILKGKFRLAKPDVQLIAISLGVVFNVLRALTAMTALPGGVTFPHGLTTLYEAVLYGILFGIGAIGSDKLIQKIAAKTGLPVYEPEPSEEPAAPTIIPAPTVTHDGPDPALASTPERTENPV